MGAGLLSRRGIADRTARAARRTAGAVADARGAGGAHAQLHRHRRVSDQGTRVETFRLAHLNESGQESEKLLSLDGPAREIVRTGG